MEEKSKVVVCHRGVGPERNFLPKSDFFPRFHGGGGPVFSKFPEQIKNFKKKLPKINFTSTFGKKLEVEKANLPNKIGTF